MRKTLVTITLVCLAVLSTSGCGADASRPGPPDQPAPATGGDGVDDHGGDGDRADGGGEFRAPHACDLLTAEIAAEFMGLAVEPATPTDVTRSGSRFSTCGYATADAAGPIANLALEAPVDASGTSWVESAWTGVTAADPDATEVPGYGDQALWSQQLGQLVVMENGWWLSFSVTTSFDPADSTLDDAKRLADLVLPTI